MKILCIFYVILLAAISLSWSADAPDILAQTDEGYITSGDVSYYVKDIVITPPADLEKLEEYIKALAVNRSLASGSVELPDLERNIDIAGKCKRYERTLLANIMREKLTEVSLNEDNYRKFYEEYKNLYISGENFSFQALFAEALESSSQDEKETAFKLITAAEEKLRSGQSFEKVAEEFAAMGGKVNKFGPYAPGRINPAMEQEVLALEPGKVSAHFKTSNGFFIVKLIEHNPERLKSYDEVRDDVARKAILDAKSKAVINAQAELIDRYKIEILPEFNENLQPEPDTKIVKGIDFVLYEKDLQDKIEDMAAFGGDIPRANLDLRKEALQTLLNEALFSLLARENGLDREPEFKRRMNIYREKLISDVYFQKLIDDIIKVSDADMVSYYENNPDKYMSRKKTSIGIINIEADEYDISSKRAEYLAMKAAREKAEKIRRRILEGADFLEMAKKYSTGWNAGDGGILESQPEGPRGYIVDMATSNLALGELSEPVRHKNGYYLIKLLSETPPGQLSFDEVSERIYKQVHYEKALELRKRKVDEILKSAGFKLESREKLIKTLESMSK